MSAETGSLDMVQAAGRRRGLACLKVLVWAGEVAMGCAIYIVVASVIYVLAASS